MIDEAGAVRQRRDLFVLLLLGWLLFSSGLGLKNPWPPDEPRFALIARDMAESGDWLFPDRAGQLYPDKPPLFMWEQAVWYKLTGSVRLSHALPSILAALVTLLLVWDLSRRLWNRRVAWWAGLTLLAVLQFPMQAKSGQIDATLCMWTTLGLYGLCRHLLRGPDWPWCWVAGAAMGFGIITKGVGFLPILILIPWAFAKLRSWPRLPAVGGWRWGLVALACLGAVTVWLAPMLLYAASSDDPTILAYRDNILFHQTADRYVESWGHIKPMGYFLTSVIPSMWLPVTLLVPWLVPAWRRRLKRRDARYLLLLGWIVLVVFFFSLSPGKRGVYILPAVPALAIAVAPMIPGLLRRRGVQRTGFVVLVFLTSLILIGAALGIFVRPEEVLKLEAEHGVKPWALLATFGIWGFALATWLRSRRGLSALVLFLWGGWMLFGWWAYPLFDAGRSATALMQRTAHSLKASDELGMIDWREQMILHADRPVTHFGFGGKLDDRTLRSAAVWVAEAPGRRLMLPERRMAPCFDPQGAVDLGTAHRRHWRLVDAENATGACDEGPVDPNPRYRSRDRRRSSTAKR